MGSSTKVPFFLPLSSFLYEVIEITLQFFDNDGFSVIIIFYVSGDFFCSHISGSVRLTSDNDLTTEVYL